MISSGSRPWIGEPVGVDRGLDQRADVRSSTNDGSGVGAQALQDERELGEDLPLVGLRRRRAAGTRRQ